MILRRTVLGKPLWVSLQPLDQGVDIGIFGGDSTHVGAVTLAEPDGTEQTLQRLSHKDAVISRQWALSLSQKLGISVCVRCGIHYDNLSPDGLRVALDDCAFLLDEVQDALSEFSGRL